MLDLNWPAILLQILGFLLLVVAFKALFWKPIGAILDQRREEVQQTLEHIQADRRAMEEARADYERRLANIEAEARERIQAAIKDAQALRDEIVNDARAEAQRLRERAAEEIAREKQKALIELRAELADLAVDAASRILRRSLDPQIHREVIQEFVGQISPGSGTSDRIARDER